MMRRLLTQGGLAVFLLAFSFSVAWARPELMMPLQRIDFAAKTVTFGDQNYRLADEVRWVGLGDRRPQDVVPLLVGNNMGVVIRFTPGMPEVTEIWIAK